MEYLKPAALVGSLVYSVLGILLVVVSFIVIDKITPYDLWKQLVEERNQPLATVVAAVRWGVPWGQAWALAGAEWRRVGTAFALADQIGVAPTGPLARASADLRTAARHEGGLAAARLGVRLVLPLGLAFLPAFVLLTVVPLVGSLAEQLLGP